MCKQHCIQAGGCTRHGVIAGHSAVPATPDPASNTVPLPSNAPPPPVAPNIDPLLNPRYAQQIAPIFTDIVRQDQEREERERQRSSTINESADRAKYSIPVYLWKVDGKPKYRVFQAGLGNFEWPWFRIDTAMLEALGVQVVDKDGQPNPPSLELYDDAGGLGLWAGIDLGHAIRVSEGSRILIKLEAVETCEGIEQLSQPAPRAPHLRENLAGTALKRSRNDAAPAPQPSRSQSTHDSRSIAGPSRSQSTHNSRSITGSSRLAPVAGPSRSRNESQSRSAAGPSGNNSRLSIKQEFHDTSFSSPVKIKIEPGTSGAASTSRTVIKKAPESDEDFGPMLDALSSGMSDSDLGSTDARAIETSGNDSDSEGFYDIDDNVQSFPGDYYACQIIKCFKAMALAKANRPKRGDAERIFESHFPGCRYIRSTFWDQAKRFNKLPHRLQTKAVKAGYTVEGLWSNVMKDAPSLKKGKGRTVRATFPTPSPPRRKATVQHSPPRRAIAHSPPHRTKPRSPKVKREKKKARVSYTIDEDGAIVISD